MIAKKDHLKHQYRRNTEINRVKYKFSQTFKPKYAPQHTHQFIASHNGKPAHHRTCQKHHLPPDHLHRLLKQSPQETFCILCRMHI